MKPAFSIRRDPDGEDYIEVRVKGQALHRHPLLNKGTAFPHDERVALGLSGFLPPRVVSMDEQKERVLKRYRRIDKPIDRYSFLQDLMDRNEILFYRILVDNIEELMPIVYTPTVGEACRTFGNIFRLVCGRCHHQHLRLR